MTSCRNPAGDELLFLSKQARTFASHSHLSSRRADWAAQLRRVPWTQAVFKPPKAIRGGVPVCWPQFSDFGPLGQHGFARNEVRVVSWKRR